MSCILVAARTDLVELNFAGSSLLIPLVGVINAERTIANPASDINKFIALFVVDAMHS